MNDVQSFTGDQRPRFRINCFERVVSCKRRTLGNPGMQYGGTTNRSRSQHCPHRHQSRRVCRARWASTELALSTQTNDDGPALGRRRNRYGRWGLCPGCGLERSQKRCCRRCGSALRRFFLVQHYALSRCLTTTLVRVTSSDENVMSSMSMSLISTRGRPLRLPCDAAAIAQNNRHDAYFVTQSSQPASSAQEA